MPRVIHFEVHADDPERVARFYTEAFGWEIKKSEGPTGYWLVTTGEANQPGINGGIMKRTGPATGTVNIISVPSVDGYAARAGKNGGKVLTPKITMPGVGYLIYCQDIEGITFGLMQDDASAK
ncbi:MAG TPA: VOC family protein [Haliangiales bacterium]|nr:VOC family protein [Haliangiales bacterium]